MSLAALDAIDDAVDATRSLLTPLAFGRWARLALVVFFLGGTGAVNPVQFANFGTVGDSGTTMDPGQAPSLSEFVSSITPTEWAIIGAVVGAILLIGLAFGFVSAVMEFVFVESLRQERVSIRQYWGDHWRRGGRLFGFRLVVGLLSLAAFLGIFWAAFGQVLLGNASLSLAVTAIAIVALLALSVLSALVTGFTTQFVVPVMLAENRSVLAAWREFWPTLTGEWKQYLTYVVVRFVLGIAVGVISGVVSMIGAVALGIPAVILGIVGLFLTSVVSIVGWAVIALAVVLFVVGMFTVSLLVAVPIQTFMRYYALLVLGDTEEAFDLIPAQRREIRDEDDGVTSGVVGDGR